MDEKPKNIPEYIQWLKNDHKIDLSDRVKNHYELATEKMKLQFIESPFWKDLSSNLAEYNDEYLIEKKYRLFQETKTPEILIKPYKSIIIKSFRKNILENEGFPNAPKDGWVFPETWYSLTNDILRTTLVVKYLDGVEFIKNKIESLCKKNTQWFSCTYEAREVGYYAVHLYTKEEFEIPRMDWDSFKVITSIEIQITTQLQELIRNLLHKYYEEQRIKESKKTEKSWQWDYASNEFATNYLGHILHYVEGMIMDIREKEKTNG